jgi:hypothetical protein
MKDELVREIWSYDITEWKLIEVTKSFIGCFCLLWLGRPAPQAKIVISTAKRFLLCRWACDPAKKIENGADEC